MLPIVGTVIRKVWYDPAPHADAGAGWFSPARSWFMTACGRCRTRRRSSEEITLYPGEITERRVSGQYRDITYVESDAKEGDTEAAETLIEQHRGLDLDGDGYREPYVVTVHKRTQKVARIVADFEASDVVRGQNGIWQASGAAAISCPYHFLPSLNGGFHGTGLGLLAGRHCPRRSTPVINMIAGRRQDGLNGRRVHRFGLPHQERRAGLPARRVEEDRGARRDDQGLDRPADIPGPDRTLFELLGLLVDAG